MKTAILFIAAFFSISLPSFAQQQKGDKEIAFNATYFNIPDADLSFGIVQGKYGRYFTDRIEAGVTPIITFLPGDTQLGTGIFGIYSFLLKDAKTVPYAGAQLLMPDISNSDMYALGLQGGAKYFFRENTLLDGNINFLTTLSGGSGVIYISLGFGFIFR